MTTITSADDDGVLGNGCGIGIGIGNNNDTNTNTNGRENYSIESEKKENSDSCEDERNKEHSSVVVEALELKEEGNRYFAQGLYQDAHDSYERGLLSLCTSTMDDDGVTKERPSLVLHVALLSNSALTLIKLELYEAAERQCTKALQLIIQRQNEKKREQQQQLLLDNRHNGEDIHDINTMSQEHTNTTVIEVIPPGAHTKVWYRRAQARESLGLLREAIGDLEQCLFLFNPNDPNNDNNNNNKYSRARTTSKSTIDNIHSMMTRIQRRINHACSNNNNNVVQSSMICPDYQKRAILKLLRQSGNTTQHESQFHGENTSKHSNDDTPINMTRLEQNHNRELPIKEGEAYFLINFEWWKKWCLHVGFFSEDQQQLPHSNDDNGDDLYAKRILKMLPVGASLPIIPNHHQQQPSSLRRKSSSPSVTNSTIDDGDDDDDHDDDLSSSSSELDEDYNNHISTTTLDNYKIKPLHPAPGIIDNSILFSHSTHDHNRPWRQPLSSFSPKQSSSTSSQLQLRINLVRGHHYEVIPREVYNAFRCWYGERTPELCFRAQPYTDFNNNNIKKDGLCILLYPHFQHSQNHKNNDPISTERTCAACGALNATKRCTTCTAVYYCSRDCQYSHWPYYKNIVKLLHKQTQKQQQLQQQQNNSMSTTIKYQHDNRLILKNSSKFGRTGLNNLGNTCFMNSALQCLSHTIPLTRYFLNNSFQNDLNTQNPLGTGGKLANAYNLLLRELWMANHNNYSPTTLKRAIAVFAPRFAGCAQHDAQEFLAFLLDGLHEDLNRIKHAPYVEMPEVTENKKLTIAGAEAWDAHCLRNDSFIMDTFYGQFKSTCVCPQCNKVSVSFDAFNHISLEIPTHQNNNRIIVVFVILTAHTVQQRRQQHEVQNQKNRNKYQHSYRPSRYGISISKNATIGELKRSLSKLTGIPPPQLVLCDSYENNVYEVLLDNKSVSTIRAEDITIAYEVNYTNSPSIHTIITHNRYIVADDLSNYVPTKQKITFGFPLIVFFNTETTCNQVWEYLWKQICYAIGDDNDDQSDSTIYSCNNEKHLLSILITDNNGNPRPIFSNFKGDCSAEETKNRSVLPRQSNERIANFLGKDFEKSFLFLSLEWSNSHESKKANFSIDYDRFSQYDDHPCLMESIKLQKELSSGAISLDKCFENFTTPERLDENNKWYCSKCKGHVRAMKTMEIWKLPNILIVHLKRFEFKHALRREKLDTYVDFPMEGLNMSKHCASISSQQLGSDFVVDSIPADYDLFAVVNHYGRMGFGHYTAFARRWNENGIESEWASFDDSSVQKLGDGYARTNGIQITTSAAYVLFYRRRIFS